MKRTTVFLLVATAVIALFTYSIFTASQKANKQPPATTVVRVIEDKADSIIESYFHEIERLLRENDSLYYQIRETKADLLKVKQKSLGSEEKVKKFSSRIVEEKDTAQKLVYCDSLRVEVDSLIETVHIKDRLYEEVVGNLTTMVVNKDSIIWACEETGSGLKSLLDTSLKNQEELIAQVDHLEKKIKKKERRWRWITGSIAILSTVTTAVLIKR